MAGNKLLLPSWNDKPCDEGAARENEITEEPEGMPLDMPRDFLLFCPSTKPRCSLQSWGARPGWTSDRVCDSFTEEHRSICSYLCQQFSSLLLFLENEREESMGNSLFNLQWL